MSLWRKPPARRRKTFFVTTASGKPGLAPAVFDLATSARLVSVAILFLTVLAAVELTMDEAFYIYHPAVIGNQRTPASEIVAASGMEGLHVFWLEPEQITRSLLSRLPELNEAFVWCGLAGCTIQVAERQPVFEWRQGQARTWVDAEGVAFPARGQTPDVPVIQVGAGVATLLPGHQTEAGLVSTMLSLAKTLPEVKSYRFTPEHGIEFQDPQGGWPVYVGVDQFQQKDTAARVAMWRALSASLASRNIRPKFVDVRYPSAPFYGK